MTDVLKLPDAMDTSAARMLHEGLLARRGRPVGIDASGVRKMGALSIEVLLSAARQWDEDDRTFSIIGMSSTFTAALKDLGVQAEFDQLVGAGEIS